MTYQPTVKNVSDTAAFEANVIFSERERILLSDAKLKLDNNNIIIGERHDAATARGFLIKLIEAGKVNDIYLEFPDLECDVFGGDGQVKLSSYLNEREYDSLIQDSVFNEFSSDCSAITGAVDNEIPLSELMLIARGHDVKIHLIDNFIPKNSNILDRVKERNMGMATSFNSVKGVNKGVILVGANHCNLGEKSLHNLCDIPEPSIYDLSI
ncbi:hypothetical protein IHA61_004492 [Salmonella enterica]|nr:hypothetical protein [Salmonella enterica]ELZ0502367.1 hypothetical protein [Salmonella enterica]